MARHEDVEMLKTQDAERWNRWRQEKGPNYRPNLEGLFAQRGSRFEGFDFSHCDLSDQFRPTSFWDCHMNGCDFTGAKLHGVIMINTPLGPIRRDGREHPVSFRNASMIWANLRGACCRGADFTNAVLEQSELTGTDLSYANLTGVKMQRSIVSGTNLSGTRLVDCQLAGVSAWHVRTNQDTVQANLDITTRWWNQDPPLSPGEIITLDDIEVAQYVHMLLNNQKIRQLVNVGSSKTVLILGRFSPPERKAVLDELRERLRQRDLVPMIFDFERPIDRDFTETVKTLASMSRFVISDLTLPKSNPLELQAAIPDFKVPVVPILDVSVDPFEFAMFRDLTIYPWVLPLLEYQGRQDLMEVLDAAVIDRANALHAVLRNRKAETMQRVSTQDFRG